MTEVSATEAARHFADLLDSVEHRGERITIVRRGKAVALIEPILSGHGSEVKMMMRRRSLDSDWSAELSAVRNLVKAEERT